MDHLTDTGSPANEKVTPAPMDAALKAKWVEALRSERFKQAYSSLVDMDERGSRSFCCLGVLCEVAGASWDEIEYERGRLNGAQVRSKKGSFLSDEVLEIVGLDDDTQRKLASLNDGGSRFPEIADYIEANL